MELSLYRYLQLIEAAERLSEAYTRPTGRLRDYLHDESFDPHEFWPHLAEWIVANRRLKSLNAARPKQAAIKSLADLEEADPGLFYLLSREDQKLAQSDVIERMMRERPEAAPSWAHMTPDRHRLLPRTTWLIHFTNNPWEIAREGFQIGAPDIGRLGLTRYFGAGAKGPGYNFALLPQSRDAYDCGTRGGYGSDAVMFQSSGVSVFHHGDEENQIIFDGPAVDPRGIVVLTRSYDDWTVHARKDVRRGLSDLFTGD